MSPTRIEEENTEERTVFDSGATAHYYPTAFDEESPNDGRYQITERVTAEFKNELVRLISAGALVRVALSEELLAIGTLVQPADRRPQTYARTTVHVRPEQPSLNRIRLSAAGNTIQDVDISSNYLHIPFDTQIAELPAAVRQRIGRDTYTRNFCHTCGNDGTRNHHDHQCRDEDARRSPR